MFKKVFKKAIAFASVAVLALGTLPVANAASNCWWVAPCICVPGVAEDIELDVEVSLKINGEDVAIDASAGDAFWAEATGNVEKADCVRLYGGWNNWATKYIDQPNWGDNNKTDAAIKSIEYTVTIKESSEDLSNATAWVGFGGDTDDQAYMNQDDNGEFSGSWAMCYNSPTAEDNNQAIKVTSADKIEVGVPFTIGLEFPDEGSDAPAADPATDPAPAQPADTTPATGDNTMVAVLAVAALVSLAGVVVASKKRA